MNFKTIYFEDCQQDLLFWIALDDTVIYSNAHSRLYQGVKLLSIDMSSCKLKYQKRGDTITLRYPVREIKPTNKNFCEGYLDNKNGKKYLASYSKIAEYKFGWAVAEKSKQAGVTE